MIVGKVVQTGKLWVYVPMAGTLPATARGVRPVLFRPFGWQKIRKWLEMQRRPIWASNAEVSRCYYLR